MDADAQTETMENRHGSQHAVSRFEHRIRGGDLCRKRVEILIGQFNTLVGARGSAGVKDDGCVIGIHMLRISPEARLAHIHEIFPHDDGCILWDLLDFASFCKHIAGFDRPCHLILHAGDDDIHKIGPFADRIYFGIKLIQRDDRLAVGCIDIKFQLLFCG